MANVDHKIISHGIKFEESKKEIYHPHPLLLHAKALQSIDNDAIFSILFQKILENVLP